VYNNASSVRELFDRLCVALEPITDEYEVIFINDGSSDDSWKIIRSMCTENTHCVGIQLSRNFGQHPAINAGLERARGDITVLMDADLQDRPEELSKILAPFESDEELEIVYTRFEMEAGGKSRVTSRIFNRLFIRITGSNLPSNVGTYRAFTRRVREALLDYPEVGAVYGPLMVQLGYEQTYVTVSRSAAVGRKTSYTFGKRLELAISALISYNSFLHWVVTLAGVFMSGLSGLFLTAITVQYLAGTRALVNGQLLLIGITVLLSGVLLMCIGILTAYTTRIFHEVLSRPKYHVARELGSGLASEDRR
jgi:glycosyltransferase involved in cell wall biosynthesis